MIFDALFISLYNESPSTQRTHSAIFGVALLLGALLWAGCAPDAPTPDQAIADQDGGSWTDDVGDDVHDGDSDADTGVGADVGRDGSARDAGASDATETDAAHNEDATHPDAASDAADPDSGDVLRDDADDVEVDTPEQDASYDGNSDEDAAEEPQYCSIASCTELGATRCHHRDVVQVCQQQGELRCWAPQETCNASTRCAIVAEGEALCVDLDDANEPNDTPNEATQIEALPATIEGSLIEDTDQDMFRVDVEAPGVLWVALDPNMTGFERPIRVWACAPSQGQASCDYDDATVRSPQSTQTQRLEALFLDEPGEWIVVFTTPATTQLVEYRAELTWVPWRPEEDEVFNHNYHHAMRAARMDAIEGELADPSETDMVRLEVDAPGELLVRVSGGSLSWICDRETLLLGRCFIGDALASSAWGGHAYLRTTLEQAGEYIVLLGSERNQDVRHYRLAVGFSPSGEPPCPPDHRDGGDGACVPAGTCAAGFHNDGGFVPRCVPVGTCAPNALIQDGGSCWGWYAGEPAPRTNQKDDSSTVMSSAGYIVSLRRPHPSTYPPAPNDEDYRQNMRYDLATSLWEPIPTPPEVVSGGSACPLPDGRVVVVGGDRYESTSSDPQAHAEDFTAVMIYDPETNAWSVGADAGVVDPLGQCATLPDGSVLAGQARLDWGAARSMMRYLPDEDAWVAVESSARLWPGYFGVAPVVLPDGRVFVFDGADYVGHIYDAEANAWETTPPVVDVLPEQLRGPDIVLLESGRVWVGGGQINRFGDVLAVTAMHLYDPASGQWQQLGDAPGFAWIADAVAIGGDRVILHGRLEGGDGSRTVVYDVANDRWTPLPEPNAALRQDSHLVLLGDGRLMISGESFYGYSGEGTFPELLDLSVLP